MDRKMRLGWLLSIVAMSPTWVIGTEDAGPPVANPSATYGVELQGFRYPYPVKQFSFSSQRQMLHMTYMDVLPVSPNGRTAVMLHGKNTAPPRGTKPWLS
jgi:hypothetical protein